MLPRYPTIFCSASSNTHPVGQVFSSFIVNRVINPLMGKFGSAKDDKDEIEIALREALANAVIHGNHETSDLYPRDASLRSAGICSSARLIVSPVRNKRSVVSLTAPDSMLFPWAGKSKM